MLRIRFLLFGAAARLLAVRVMRSQSAYERRMGRGFEKSQSSRSMRLQLNKNANVSVSVKPHRRVEAADRQ